VNIGPVLVVGFNRTAPLTSVLDAVSEVQPSTVYMALDGPRPDRPEDREACGEVRALVESYGDRVQLVTKVSEVNQGCAHAMKSALDWFFAHERQGIILEDDCVPHPRFFTFCELLLERYRDDPRVWMITGNNLLTEYGSEYGDYFFSDGGVWGWASWRDRWSRATLTPQLDATAVQNARRALGRREWRRIRPRVEAAAKGELDTWDYQWLFTRVSNHGLAVVPSSNLVTNVGFGPGATHTHQPAAVADLPLVSINIPPVSSAPTTIDGTYIRRRARLTEPSLRDKLAAKISRR